MKTAFSTDKAPRPAGYYSQAIRAGDFIYLAGQTPRSAGGEPVPTGISAQTRQTLENLSAVAIAAGASLADAVKVTAYLTRIEDFAEFDVAYREYFSDPPPARTTVVAGLRGIDVELDAILYSPSV
jgi:2-iminobutanoate/2-iminopropanoate deaminase